ncbi:MAG: phosphoribosyltransferase [Bacteriovoracaceae bacterium]
MAINNLFQDRRDAGKRLGKLLDQMHFEKPILLALPRGGVVVGDEVAELLHLPLDVVISRKIGAPGEKEFGIGAISEDEDPIFNHALEAFYDFDSELVEETVGEEVIELRRRIQLYRHGNKIPEIKDKIVILIDDGLATGVTAIAAAKFLKSKGPKKIILAVPLGPKEISQELRENFDEIISLYELYDLRAIGIWYKNFDQVEDDEVIKILEKYH